MARRQGTRLALADAGDQGVERVHGLVVGGRTGRGSAARPRSALKTSRLRAITRRWISLVPSPIVQIFESR